jgi:hypothetical protein
MPSSPRTRTGLRLVAWLALAAGVSAAPAGCETLRPTPQKDAAEPAVQSDVPRGADPAAPPQPAAAAPGQHATRRGHYVFYHDFEFPANDPLFAELDALPDQVFGELGLPPATGIIQVFLFDTQERYERYMRVNYPHLPPRRAYFIAVPHMGGADDLKIFTWMGDHLRTDLRHELTHALLHSVLKDVPIWLDEGLAGFFELQPAQDGVNPQHLEYLRRGPFQPSLGRLEKLTEVADMGKQEYREAWAWVHLMLRGDPTARQVLRDYLQGLRAKSKPGPLGPRLKDVLSDPEQALAAHLAGMQMPRQTAAQFK